MKTETGVKIQNRFSYSTPVITNIVFQVNRPFKKGNRKRLTVPIHFQRGLENTFENGCHMTINLEVGKTSDDFPFNLMLSVEADFKWEKNVSKRMRDDFLNQSAVALLLSYARPVISNIIVQAGFPPYNLPFFDLTGVQVNKK